MVGSILRFGAILIAIVFAHVLVWHRLARATGLTRRVQRLAALGLAVLTGMGVAALATRSNLSLDTLRTVGFSWLGVAFFLFWALAILELPRALEGAWSRAKARRAPEGGVPLPDPARRQTLARIFAGGASAMGLATAAAGAVEAQALAVRRVRVPLGRLPAALDGLRLVQISDLHVGPSIHRAYVERVVAAVNELAPDVIAITGDLVDGHVDEIANQVAPIANLRAKHGVFFVTGNHEYYSGVKPWLEHLTQLGLRVLMNERVSIGDEHASFDLAGVPDFHAQRRNAEHRHDVDAAVAGRDPTRELVLLAHQPRSAYDAARLGVGLQLSGHTHGGQLFPLGLFLFDQPFVKGLHRMDDTWVYVSCGTGYWGPPMRVGAPPEITEVTLTRV